MSLPTYYLQECPVCGRPLRVRVTYLGRQIRCDHCRGSFVAVDPSNRSNGAAESTLGLLERAEQLLNLSSRRLDWAYGSF